MAIGGDKQNGYGNRRRPIILEITRLTIPCNSFYAVN